MRATSSTLENNRIKLTVEVDETEMNDAMEAAAKSLSKQVSIKGFRKGKVPKNVLIAHLGGVEALRAEAIRESMPDFYAHAVSDTLTDPIGQPDINITAGEESGPLTFEAEVEVRPEASIKGHRDLRVEIPSPRDPPACDDSSTASSPAERLCCPVKRATGVTVSARRRRPVAGDQRILIGRTILMPGAIGAGASTGGA